MATSVGRVIGRTLDPAQALGMLLGLEFEKGVCDRLVPSMGHGSASGCQPSRGSAGYHDVPLQLSV